jgi:hypothetical protein
MPMLIGVRSIVRLRRNRAVGASIGKGPQSTRKLSYTKIIGIRAQMGPEKRASVPTSIPAAAKIGHDR